MIQTYLINTDIFKPGITTVIITNVPISDIKSLKKVLEISDKIIVVTNRLEDSYSDRKLSLIYSKSQNYAYLRNLGAYYADTTHIFVIDSDELIDDSLITALKNIDYKQKLYCMKVSMYIGSYKMMMTSNYGNRLYDKRYFFYIGRVHEQLFGSVKKCFKVDGEISNFSQENWDEWYRKAIRYTSQENIKWDLLLRSTYPLYAFFRYQGWRDGVLGIKWTLKRLQYIIMIFLHGQRGYKTLNPENILKLISVSNISIEEKKFISFILKQHFQTNHVPFFKRDDIVNSDFLEQISSPFFS